MVNEEIITDKLNEVLCLNPCFNGIWLMRDEIEANKERIFES